MAGKILKACTSFSIEWEGKPIVVKKGTTVREGHPLAAAFPSMFDELVPTFEHASPTKATPEPPAKTPPPPPTKRTTGGRSGSPSV